MHAKSCWLQIKDHNNDGEKTFQTVNTKVDDHCVLQRFTAVKGKRKTKKSSRYKKHTGKGM